MIYKDIDAFLENTAKNDFSIIEGIASCVKNTLYNNLLISSKEIPFDMTLKPDIEGAVHATLALTSNMQITDAVEWAAKQDRRITKIVQIQIVEDNERGVVINLKVKMADNINEITSFNIQVIKK